MLQSAPVTSHPPGETKPRWPPQLACGWVIVYSLPPYRSAPGPKKPAYDYMHPLAEWWRWLTLTLCAAYAGGYDVTAEPEREPVSKDVGQAGGWRAAGR